MNSCVLCNNVVAHNYMTSPFREEHSKRVYYPERYAHICKLCLEKCHNGEVTEEQWNKAIEELM